MSAAVMEMFAGSPCVVPKLAKKGIGDRLTVGRGRVS